MSDKAIKLVKINNTILEKLMESSTFKVAVIDYLSTTLISEQKDEITRKLSGLTKKWKDRMQTHDLGAFKALCNSIETDAKFKLPWTVTELVDAVKAFEKLVNKLGEENSSK